MFGFADDVKPWHLLSPFVAEARRQTLPVRSRYNRHTNVILPMPSGLPRSAGPSPGAVPVPLARSCRPVLPSGPAVRSLSRPFSRFPAMSQLLSDYPLLHHNTFGFKMSARATRSGLANEAQVSALAQDGRIAGLPMLVLGGGSNVVLTRDFDGVAVARRIAWPARNWRKIMTPFLWKPARGRTGTNSSRGPCRKACLS